jgi:ABC transport system ATP-binding/permease protein
MHLTVIEGKEQGRRIELFAGKVYLIGREHNTCDIVISDPQASRIHAEIRVDQSGNIFIADKNSQNGTYLNNQPLTTIRGLKCGDQVTIGSSIIKLAESTPGLDIEPYSKPARTGTSYTRIAPTSNTSITIGRDQSNHLMLNHPHVSRFHAVVDITDRGWFIRDLNSTNGTYVDGARITGAHPLNTNSVIRISGYRLNLDDFNLVTSDETAGRIKLEVRELSKVVTTNEGEELVLLNNINFKVEPREFVAILGGSGAGKSTLLKALMGTSPANFGEILINGTDYYQEYGSFKSLIGYVPQDDIIHLELTVEEALQYAARLRMPDDTTAEERNLRVDEVMDVLELTFRRSTPIKKLSGGQRKRVSIGVEIITKPSIMFLDEPTSGLDPGLEKLMMQMMRNMANRGQTIFCVTHATFNIHLCDKVLFLTEGGRLAFFGSPKEALAYFGTDDFAEIYRMINIDDSPEQWQCRYNLSDLAAKYYPIGLDGNDGAHTINQVNTRQSSVMQWFTLTSRFFKVMLRDRKNLLLLFLQPILIATGVGLLFMGGDVLDQSPYLPEDLVITEEVIIAGDFDLVTERIDQEVKRIEDIKVLLLVTIITAVWFGAANSVSEIVKENSIYKRERSVNLRIAPYLMSKAAVLSFICLMQSVIFITILWTLIGLPNYILFVLAFFLIISASAMLGLAVSAFVASASTATSMLPLLLLPQIVLSGGLMPIDELEPEFVQSIFNLAISKWGYELVGGGILDVNNLLGFEAPFSAFEGSFGGHWLWLAGHFTFYYIIATIAMVKKDKDLT